MDIQNKQTQEKRDFVNALMEQNLDDLTNAEAVLEREVSPIGNSGHITIPKEFIGKSAKVIIRRNRPNRVIELRQYFKNEEEKK